MSTENLSKLAMPMIKINILEENFDSAMSNLNKLVLADEDPDEMGTMFQNIYFTFRTLIESKNQSIIDNNYDHFLKKIAEYFGTEDDLELFMEKAEAYEKAKDTLDYADDIIALDEIISIDIPLRLKCRYLNSYITIVSNETEYYLKYKTNFDRAVKELKKYHELMNSKTLIAQ